MVFSNKYLVFSKLMKNISKHFADVKCKLGFHEEITIKTANNVRFNMCLNCGKKGTRHV